MSAADKEEGALVLVVDDYRDGRELVVDIMSLAGFRTAEAADGLEALELVQRLRPDAVLMDLSLPQVDGWEVTRRIRRDPATKDIPVIALTAHALPSDARGARAAGCDGFITKPCSSSELLKAVREALDKRER